MGGGCLHAGHPGRERGACLSTVFALFTIPWLEVFEASRRDVMITISVLQVGMGVLGPFVGRIMDVVNMRWLVMAGAIILAFGLWLVQHATALWQLWLIYGTIMPLSTVLMGTLASQTLVAKWFTEQRGLALGISAMGTNLGGVVFPLVVAGWLEAFGWRETFAYLGVTVALVAIPLTLLVLRREPPAAQEIPVQGTVPKALSERVWTTGEILRSSRFWLPFLSLLPMNMAFGAVQYNLAIYARDLAMPDGTAATLITLSSICMLAGKLFFGSLGDRVDHRVLFWIANTCTLIALAMFVIVENYWPLIFAVVFLGLSGGGILPMMGVIFAARFGAASFGRVMGVVMMNILFGAAAPVIAGWVYDVQGSYDAALWAFFALTVPAMIAMIWLPPPLAESAKVEKT